MSAPRGQLSMPILAMLVLGVIASHSGNDFGDTDSIVEEVMDEAVDSQDHESLAQMGAVHRMPDGTWMRGSTHEAAMANVIPMHKMPDDMKIMEKKVTKWASPGYYQNPKKKKGWVPGHNMGMMESHGMLAPIECNLRGASLALTNEPDQRKFKKIRAAMQEFTQVAIDTPIKHVGMDGYYGCVICSKTCNFFLYECVNQPWGHPAKHSDIMTFLHKQGGMAKYNKLQQLVDKDKTFRALAKQREEVVCSMHM